MVIRNTVIIKEDGFLTKADCSFAEAAFFRSVKKRNIAQVKGILRVKSLPLPRKSSRMNRLVTRPFRKVRSLPSRNDTRFFLEVYDILFLKI